MARREKSGIRTPAASGGGPAHILPFPTRAAAPEPELPRPRRIAYLAAPFAVFFLGLAVVELGVRATLPHLSTLEAFVQAPQDHRGFRDVRGVNVFEGDPLLFWRLAPNLAPQVWDFTPVATNAQGLRYPRNVGPKTAGILRIACFGDSITFGYRVPVVWPEHPQDYDRSQASFPQLLESALSRAEPSRAVEVLPMAVPGYSSHQGLAWLQREIADLAPDVVVASYGWNDVNSRARTDRETMHTGIIPVLLRRLTSRSQALLHASVRWRRRRGAPGPNGVLRVPLPDYVENMRAIVRVAAAHGATVLVLGPMFRDPKAAPDEARHIAEHRKALREAMAADGTPYLEIPELTEEGWPANDRLFGERIHPNAEGHRLIAERLLETLKARALLPGAAPPAGGPVS